MTNSRRTMTVTVALAMGLMGWPVLDAQGDRLSLLQVAPGDLKWTPITSMAPGAHSTVIVGDPGKAGLYVARVKLPPNYKVAAHTHPEDRVITVISGTYYVGFGIKFDESKLKPLTAGSVYTEPAKVAHFGATRSEEAIVQVSAVGPSAIDYLDPADDPGKKK